MINMEKEVFYTIEEVAIMLKVAYLTVYRWIQSGRLEAVKAGKQYRIRQSQLDDFLINYKK
jgi:excisionase family DNA binding protein